VRLQSGAGVSAYLPANLDEGGGVMRARTLVVLFATGLVAVSAAVAGVNRNWSTHMNGSMEVPIRDTQGEGQAIFQLSKDGDSIDYKLIASNIDNVFMAHIHREAPGVNGPIVVWLYPSTTPQNPATLPKGTGRTDGVLAEGTFTDADVLDLPGGVSYSFAQLLDDMRSGRAYVNVHTDDGVAPTNTGPGDFFGGEIRGDIR
jgi:CHRD domain